MRFSIILAFVLASFANAQFTYRCRGEVRSLPYDPQGLAVRSLSFESGEAVLMALRNAAIDARLAERWADGKWWLVETSLDWSSAEALRSALAAVAALPGVDFVSPIHRDPRGEPLLLSSTAIVAFKNQVLDATNEEAIARSGFTKIAHRDFARIPGCALLESPTKSGLDLLDAVNRLALESGVEFAEPDFLQVAQPFLTPNDPGWPSLWGLQTIGCASAWELTTGRPTINVLVLDDGVQNNHPDLNYAAGLGLDATGQGQLLGAPGVDDIHGTAVAGVVAAKINNSLGTIGVAPGCKVVSARVADGSGSGVNATWTLQSSWIIQGLDYAATIGARLTVFSYGLSVTSSALETKLQSTRDQGVCHFVAAGNGGAVAYPASLASVNAVGALNQMGGVTTTTSATGASLDFIAPGVNIYTTDRTGAAGYDSASDYTTQSGTSLAAPAVAGVAALILSLNPTLSPAQIEAVLRASATDTAPPGFDNDSGWGAVNAAAACRLSDSLNGLQLNFAIETPGIVEATGSSDFGRRVIAVGDLDGDGIVDPVVSVPEAKHVGNGVPIGGGSTGGPDHGGVIAFSSSTRQVLWAQQGPPHTFTGSGLAAAGFDFDSDGLNDVLVGSPLYSSGGGSGGSPCGPGDAGRIFLLSGASGAVLNNWGPVCSPGYDGFGAVIEPIGDSVDGDAIPDFVVGQTITSAGAASALRASGLGIQWLEIDSGTGSNHREFGHSVGSILDDINGDGKFDVIVGDPIGIGSNNGRIVALSGAGAGSTGFTIWSQNGASDSNLGTAVAGLGADVDGDGFNDVLVGAPGFDAPLTDVGAVELRSGLNGNLIYRVAGAQNIGQSFGAALRAIGDVDADGTPDFAVGAPGAARTPGSVAVPEGMVAICSGRTGLILTQRFGLAPGMRLGSSISTLPDLDGDGFEDIAVSAPQALTTTGRLGVLLVFTTKLPPVLNVLQGTAAGQQYGRSVARIGDLNGDGHDDVVFGAPFAVNAQTGEARVVSPSTGQTLRTVSGDGRFGWSVSGASDVDLDGILDFIVGAPDADGAPGQAAFGRAYVFSGAGGLLFTLTGPSTGSLFGLAVNGGVDVNADGRPDVVVGAPGANQNGAQSGAAYVYSGLNGQLIHAFFGQAGQRLGYSAALLLDVNADGKGDVLVGAPEDTSQPGRALVYSGATGAPLFTFIGASPGDRMGEVLTSLGDYDHDGIGDFAIGVPGSNWFGADSGSALVYGGPQSSLKFSAFGSTAGIQFGSAIGLAGDIDGDGKDDVIIGEQSSEQRVTIVSPFLESEIMTLSGPSTGGQTGSGAAFAYSFGAAVSGAGDVNGDGFSDIIIGAPLDSSTGTTSGGIFVFSGQAPTLGPAGAGNVRDAAGLLFQGLAVNGSSGGTLRNVGVAWTQPWTVSLESPSNAATFALFGYIGIPGPQAEIDLPLSVGRFCFAPCLGAGSPGLFTFSASLLPGLACTALFPAGPMPYALQVPSLAQLTGLPALEIQLTLQGVTFDPGATPPLGVTNGLIVSFHP